MSHDNFVTIRQYRDPILANMVIAALHAAEIETLSVDGTGVLPSDSYAVKVLESQVEAALEVIESQENL